MELLATPSSTEPAPARTGGAPRAALPGLFVCVLVAMAADGASLIASTHGMAMGALSIALVIGLGVGNLVPDTQGSTWSAGVAFAKRHVLRTGIVLYGFRLTLGDIESAGLRVVAIDVVTLASTFALAVSVGVRLFKLDTPTAVLIGAGASICGTSAVLATAPIVGARAEHTCVAAATVAIFGTLAFLLYPLLHHGVAGWRGLPSGDAAFGTYIGSTVHEVAQVVATANASGIAESSAVVAKMGRVALLAPFLLALALWQRRQQARAKSPEAEAIRGPDSPLSVMPWFALLFAAAVVINTVAPVTDLRPTIQRMDTFALAVAMAGVGLATSLQAIRSAGAKPIALAGVVFLWLVVAGALINSAVTALS